MLIISGFRELLWTISTFALPQVPVEAVIARSILFLAREYISLKRGEQTSTRQYSYLVAFVFSLLHGFGFAGALQEIGLPQQEIPLALLTFNLGVELGQILFVFMIVICMKMLSKWLEKLLNGAGKFQPIP